MILPCGVGNLHKGERYEVLLIKVAYAEQPIDIVIWITSLAL